MDKIKQARQIFVELESQHRATGEIALRNFEIQSRLAQIRR